MSEARAAYLRRHARGDWTESEVLSAATNRDFIVHKYRDSHRKLRKLTRRMCVDGKLVMVLYDGKQFYYRKAKHEPKP